MTITSLYNYNVHRVRDWNRTRVMAAVRPIELSLTVSPVCVRLVMTMLNVNIASASLTCCVQYGIIMLGHSNVFREYVGLPIIGHFYALLLVHGSCNHALSQCLWLSPLRRYVHGMGHDPIMDQCRTRFEVRLRSSYQSKPSYVEQSL